MIPLDLALKKPKGFLVDLNFEEKLKSTLVNKLKQLRWIDYFSKHIIISFTLKNMYDTEIYVIQIDLKRLRKWRA